MKTRVRIVVGRLWIVAAVLGISMLGDRRLQASEKSSMVVPVSTASNEFAVRAGIGWDADSPSSLDDDAQLIPAIYAGDAEVRFVRERHISKWM